MSPREIRDFCRENVDTLRSAFQEILHQHFLLLSAFVPEMVDSIKASLSESLTEGSEDGERITSALNMLLVPGSENTVFCQMPRETVISSIDVAKEDLMPTNLRLWIHKANVALDYLQDNPAPAAVVDLPIPLSRLETRRPVWSSTDNSFAELIVELHKKGYIAGQSPMDVLAAVAPLFENVNPDGRTLWQGIANRAHKGNRFPSIPTAPKPRKKTRPGK